MADSLAPHRVCLLMLVDIYCRELVPPDGQLAVLTFVSAHLLPRTNPEPGKGAPRAVDRAATSLDAFRGLLQPIRDASGQASLWDHFVRDIGTISDLDKWHDYLEDLARLFTPDEAAEDGANGSAIAAPSLFGVAIRQAHLDFKKLDFHGVASKWQEFNRYVSDATSPSQETADDADMREELDRMRAMSGGVIESIIEADAPSGIEQDAMGKAYDMERLLVFQISQMQKLGTRLPDAMHDYLQDALSQSRVSPNLSNYAKFLDAWHAGDQPAAFENLHRYYDYAMHNRDRSQYQYALLNTAILQADFGQRDEAVAAMQETISTARENKDMSCLNFSMSWLYHFRVTYGTKGSVDVTRSPSDERSLALLKSKAVENKMWSIASTTLLNEARLYLWQGRRPLDALARVYEASALNLHQDVKSLQGALLILQSSFFGRLGVAPLATGYRSLMPSSQNSDLPLEDVLTVKCQSAFLTAIAGKYKGLDATFEGIVKDSNSTLKHRRLAETYQSLLRLRHALAKNIFDEAESILSNLNKFLPQDRDLAFQVSLAELDLLERKSDTVKLLNCVEKLALDNNLEGRGSGSADVGHRIRLISRKTRAWTQQGQPQKGLILSLRAVVAAIDARAMLALYEATAALSEVLMSLGESQAAEQILDAVVWQASEAEDVLLLGLLQSCYAAAAEASAQKALTPEAREGGLAEAVDWAKRALESYRAAEDVSNQHAMASMSARLLRSLGRTSEAAQHDDIAKSVEAAVAQKGQ